MTNETRLTTRFIDGTAREFTIRGSGGLVPLDGKPRRRRVYSAAHVVAEPLGASRGAGAVDWSATMAIRHRLWDLGLGVAESMDTAQRGMGLSAEQALRLGEATVREAAARGAEAVVGVTTDGLDSSAADLRELADAYIAQLRRIESAGGRVVLMASRQLAVAASSREEYLRVYGDVIARSERGVVLHWLGEMFDPALRGYWGAADAEAAAETVLELIHAHADRIDGIKLSLLDEELEVGLRRRLPAGVRLYTGDDYHYADLIAGDEEGHSDALLGAFAAVPRHASAAFAALDAGDVEGFREILGPTQALARLVFEAPTMYYKTGVAWLAYLNGWQEHFRMLDGFEAGRSIAHLVDVLALAGELGVFDDPEATAARAAAYLRGVGVAIG
ncbi:DUF993 family protein [Gulosibacter sp. 10]|uniref:DUF993 family protein n=1 Tax=Gulosibacter sp. 10 TaxID=1255570 RepID=UPI00097ECBEA|nr:DUF993 family protein [Gulosibacter sp. 10]SJM70941.1 Conserved hypothetical protein potentially related to ribose or hydroxymethylpyrimidine metabolism [Gulosibacter sp. 10]